MEFPRHLMIITVYISDLNAFTLTYHHRFSGNNTAVYFETSICKYYLMIERSDGSSQWKNRFFETKIDFSDKNRLFCKNTHFSIPTHIFPI